MLAGCSPENPAQPKGQPEVSVTGSTRRILSSRTIFRIGSADPQSSPEERPGWTRFAHDYWLDTTEVTQAEYQNLTGRNPALLAARSASKPVVNVTWFDAVLFCNARSKRDHLDTVYDYSSVSIDSTGSVWNLQGLTSHLDRNGWRLPTEAEWEYAARAGSTSAYPWGELADSANAAEYAWFQKNAGASLHEVARLKPNAWGFHDMAGNAMEWVQDWKGPFPKDTVTDYVGPDVPPDVPEAPLKGGAYIFGLEHLRPSSRSATYAAYRAAKSEYVGFRCARGGFAATYTNGSGQSVQAPPVSILRTDVARLLGAQTARLVFLNRTAGKGILSWIDYGDPNPMVRSLPDRDPVFHPVISPDGNWVAWCTVPEGSTGTSRIKARRLSKNDSTVLDLGAGAIPRWWVDGTDTFLIRSSTAMDNTASTWSAGQTVAQRWNGGGLTGTVETWSGAGGYHDGRSGQYLYTGYRRLKQYDVSGRRNRTLFTYPRNGKGVGDTSQVCNTSAAPDGSGRVMFLDFGYSGKSSLVGRPYGIHEVAFVADSLGNVIKTFPVASGKSQWDHLEWSNQPRWAVGTALTGTVYKEIGMLDLQDGTTTPLLQGAELWMPNLWVGSVELPVVADGADPDSSGAWITPSVGEHTEEFSVKIQRFWNLRNRLNIAFVGSSRGKSGVNPSLFTTGKTLNWGYSGNEAIGARSIVEHYVLPHAPRLQVVILSLMPGWMFNYRTWTWQDIAATVGFQYDNNHGFWKKGVPSSYLSYVARRTWSLSPYVDSLGGREYSNDGWGSESPPAYPPAVESFDGEPFLSNWTDLEATIAMCEQRRIHVILVNFPQNPNYKNTPYMGKYGPTWATWRKLSAMLVDLQASHPYLHYYDANMDGGHDYASSSFTNEDHLGRLGAAILSGRLDSLIKSFDLRGIPN